MVYKQYERHTQWTSMPSAATGPYALPHDRFTYKPEVIVQDAGNGRPHEPAYKQRSFKQRYLGGLKLSLRAFAFAAAIVLLVNLCWLIWAWRRFGIMSGYGTIQQGDCAAAKRLNTWLHLLINILSTLLLAGSNAFMQVFSAPTRQEVDRAHARGIWLHIGVLGIRNWRGIAKRKALVSLVLALTSIPFHLLYNSLIFTDLAANKYFYIVTTENFLSGAPFTSPAWGSACGDNCNFKALEKVQQSAASTYERLDKASCIKAYKQVYVSNRRNLVLVSSTQHSADSVLGGQVISGAINDRSAFWICSKTDDGPDASCDPEAVLENAASWAVWGDPIEYCLSERTEEKCALQFSFDIMIVVIVCNLIKLALMLYVLFCLDAEQILTSVGDAMASFLRFPDQTTAGKCLELTREVPGQSRQYLEHQGRWTRAASKKRWIFFTLLMMAALGIVSLLLAWGLRVLKRKTVNTSLTGLWNLGFGTLNANALVIVGSAGNAASMAVLANSPQFILSLIYLQYSGLLTSMFTAADFSAFAAKAQHLMVSSPAGKQRGTWLLGLPLPYALGSLAMQTLLHWLVSQSIFSVQISFFDVDGQRDEIYHVSNCGYSPIAIIFVLITGFLLAVSTWVIGARKFKDGGPPVDCTNSAAISAACHYPGVKDDALVYEELRWGVTGQAWNRKGHCSMAPASAWDQRVAEVPGAWLPLC